MPSDFTELKLDTREISKFLRTDPQVQAGITEVANAVAAASGITDVEVITDVSDRFRALVVAKHGNRATDELGGRLVAGAAAQNLEVRKS